MWGRQGEVGRRRPDEFGKGRSPMPPLSSLPPAPVPNGATRRQGLPCPPFQPHETTMRAFRLLPALTLAAAVAAQTPAPTPVTPATPAPAAPAQGQAPQAPAKLDETVYDHFGTGITKGDKPAALADVLKSPEAFTGKPVRIEGPITAVCQTKGCWMHLGDQNPPVMVKFKDYGFFMPKDSSGRTAIVEGTMAMKQETVEQTKHYLEDAGKLDEAAKVTEGRKLYTFMASGVAIQKPAK